MRKYLISENGTFYKANLHCHSTLSDGRMTIEEIKKGYMEHGYSIVAYTDHDVFLPHPELREENFLPLHGFEVETNNHTDSDFNKIKTCHMCMIALEEDTVIQPLWHRTEYCFANAVNSRKDVKFDETQPDFVREYSGECLSYMMKTYRENGFFVTYNHPVWSMENYNDYMGYNNMNAMEIVNYGCVTSGYEDTNGVQYDDMLKGGKRIYCIAADDNHNLISSYGGYTMIKADKLEYRIVTKALEDGNFYCSDGGPAIKELYVEDGKVTVKTDNARQIYIVKGCRRNSSVADEKCTLTGASFDYALNDVYFRIVVVGQDGRRSYTNAYFTDTL